MSLTPETRLEEGLYDEYSNSSSSKYHSGNVTSHSLDFVFLIILVNRSTAALGNAAFGVTAFMFFFLNTGLAFDNELKVVVLPFALICGGVTQYIVGMSVYCFERVA